MPDLFGLLLYLLLRILQLLMQLVIAGLIALQLLECGAEASDFLTGAAEFDPGLGAYFGEIKAFFEQVAGILIGESQVEVLLLLLANNRHSC